MFKILDDDDDRCVLLHVVRTCSAALYLFVWVFCVCGSNGNTCLYVCVTWCSQHQKSSSFAFSSCYKYTLIKYKLIQEREIKERKRVRERGKKKNEKSQRNERYGLKLCKRRLDLLFRCRLCCCGVVEHNCYIMYLLLLLLLLYSFYSRQSKMSSSNNSSTILYLQHNRHMLSWIHM